MTREDILRCYSFVKDQPEESLEVLVATDGVLFYNGPTEEQLRQDFEKYFRIISQFVSSYSETIKNILKTHSKTVDIIVEISYILAPAIAQEYGGIGGVSIVAALLIMTRRGIHSYLN